MYNGQSIEDLQRRVTNSEEEIHSLRNQLEQLQRDMGEVLDIIRTGKDFFKYIGYIGTAIKWSVAVVAPIVAIVMTMKGKNAG